MPPVVIDPALKAVLLGDVFRPAVTTWNRLEGRPRREDFDRSLRVEIRDPLWMLCRQWQVGEFRGEDAGSAVTAKVQTATAHINRYAGRGGAEVAYDEALPLEAKVEREPVFLDLMTRAQMGRHWIRLLRHGGDGGLTADYLAEYGFTAPVSGGDAEAQLRSDARAWSVFATLEGRVVDGARLLAAIRAGDHASWLAGVVPDTSVRGSILEQAERFVAWFYRVYSQPEPPEDPAWSDEYLEYQFALAAPADTAGDTQTVLVADQYHHGHLDWYAFDVDPGATLPVREGVELPPASLVVDEPISFVPAPIEFGGMPNLRWWEFEDRKTDLGNLRASTTELATLMLAEFGLIYGNDWSLVPYDLPAGSLCQVMGVVVTDVFGVRTLIRPTVSTTDGACQRWDLYHLSTTDGGSDPRLFLPPATPHLLESPPLERVVLARDELANMVWGIEDIIPGMDGGGVAGFEAAADLERYLSSQTDAPPSEALLDTGAQIRYRLGTRVPENWIPFLAVHAPGSNREIRLQRAALPRSIPGSAPASVEPRSAILRFGLDEKPHQPYFINEEEVPRAGVVVTRTYQRSRWWDGRTHTWLGRRKRTGRGQGSSGLAFDQIDHI